MPMLNTVGTLVGGAKGLLGLNAQNGVTDVSNTIVDEATAKAKVKSAKTTARGLEDAQANLEQNQAIQNINSHKKNAEAINY